MLNCVDIHDFMDLADSAPMISSVISAFATASFVLTSIAASLLTVSTASLQSVGTFMRSSPFLIVDPARNLFVRYLIDLRAIYTYELDYCLKWRKTVAYMKMNITFF